MAPNRPVNDNKSGKMNVYTYVYTFKMKIMAEWVLVNSAMAKFARQFCFPESPAGRFFGRMENMENLFSKKFLIIFAGLAAASVFFVGKAIFAPSETENNSNITDKAEQLDNGAKFMPPADSDLVENGEFFAVARVIDGDTFEVNINGVAESVRVIGINTPETVDPRRPVECFGVEASNKAKEILSGQSVRLEYDPTQGERDKYGRLLRHVLLEYGINFGLLMIKEGYAHEYTYAVPYKYQTEFKAAQNYARDNSLGLWGDICQSGDVPAAVEYGANGCSVKGNINAEGEKIYHIAGCEYYNQTVINESAGERWFCTEEEALSAGWRKALNCD